MDCVLLFSISAVLLCVSQALPATVRAAAPRVEHPSLIHSLTLTHSVYLLFPQVLPTDQGEFLFSPDVFFSSGIDQWGVTQIKEILAALW